MVTNIDQETLHKILKEEDSFILYLYTPLCGTCQVAGKMVEVVSELLPTLSWVKMDLNYIPDLAEKWEIENVPCLLIMNNGAIEERFYAFHSVPYLYEKIKNFVEK